MKIEAYSLYEFCQQVQEAILKGFRFDFDSNENFPTAFGTLLVAGMVEAKNDITSGEMQEEHPEEKVQEVEQSKRGRKPKE